MRGTSPEDTAIDLVIEDGSRVGTAYFLMNEANVARAGRAAVDELRISDAEAHGAATAKFLQCRTRTRAPTAISRGCSANMSATKATDAGRSGAAADQHARRQSWHRRPRAAEARR